MADSEAGTTPPSPTSSSPSSFSAPLEDLVSPTGGEDMWHVTAVPSLGLRRLRVSDGPAGARGTRWFGSSSACVPCGTALGATWSTEVVAEVAGVLAAETRSKGADVLLAPTVNIHRHPLAGRNFECMSEDPTLTAALAVSYVENLQARGVGACIKHFVANDQETDRHEISAEVPEAALREIYLRPFEDAVRIAGTWSVMSAYNRLRGTHCSQNHWLLTGVLRDEWGFDGVVVSDWWGTHDTAALEAGLDIEMPGPVAHLGANLVAPVESGEVPTGAVEAAVERIRLLAERTLDPTADQPADECPPERSVEDPAHRDVLRRAAVESMVLLSNDPVSPGDAPLVPLPPGAHVAVIGPNAADTAVMGGGSASFVPHRTTNVLDALRARLPESQVTFERGLAAPDHLRPLDRRRCTTGNEAESPEGFVVTYRDGSGTEVHVETSLTSRLLWLGEPAPGVPPQDTEVHLSTWLRPQRSGMHTFSLVTGSTGRLLIDGEVLLDNSEDRRPGTDFFGLGSEEITARVELSEGTPVLVEASTTPLVGVPAGGLAIGHGEPEPADPLGAAIEAATAADVAVVVVGGDERFETEGADRGSFSLPAGQDELIEAVLGANPNTVVVLNQGAPVDLRTAVAAPALIEIWYPGQEAGEALAEILTGASDPGGRLPTTFGAELVHWRSDRFFPGADGTVSYDEGLAVGYRGFDLDGHEPLFAFGHGLSTTTFEWSPASVEGHLTAAEVAGAGTSATVALEVTNTGERPGTEVVQCYLHPTGGDALDPQRPPQHLAAFAKVHLQPGETTTVELELGERALRRWEDGAGWVVPTGTWEVRLSRSSRNHLQRLRLEVG